MKKTKIICTIGPKTESREMLFNLIDAGMDAVRLNFSHGNYLEHSKRIKNLRSLFQVNEKKIAILLDTKGPEIRTMKLKKNIEVFLKTNQIFKFTINKKFIGNNQCVAVTYSGFPKDLSIGNIILIDDGLLSMKVIDLTENEVICHVLNNGFLGENKSINLPGISISLPYLSEKDKFDLIFGIKKNIDFIAASFVRKRSDILKIKKFLKKNGGEKIKIISKIENQEGLNNFDEILEVSDGIMVARGDLGVEIPTEEVIFAQKMIIKKCNLKRKIVITATQMLDSMINNPRPTRAEAGDVANAILDGTDAVMLSGESAKGKYPIESVKIMAKICKKTDIKMSSRVNKLSYQKRKLSIAEAICKSAVEISEKIQSPIIVVETEKGNMPQAIRKYFPKANILAVTSNDLTERQLSLSKGIICKLVKEDLCINEFYQIVKETVLDKKLAKLGEIIVVVTKYSSLSISIHFL